MIVLLYGFLVQALFWFRNACCPRVVFSSARQSKTFGGQPRKFSARSVPAWRRRKPLDQVGPGNANVYPHGPQLCLAPSEQFSLYLMKVTFLCTVGLPNLDLGIPGLSPLPSPLLPSLLPFPRGSHPLNHLGGLGSAVSSPTGVWAKSQPTNDLVPKEVVLMATVFVHFHKNKFKFLYKHKTA